MINKASDYQWVAGDLDKIKINGGIMPLRSADKKKVLRGEDIAFALEAGCERERLRVPGSTTTKTFSRNLTVGGVYEAMAAAKYADHTWVKPGYQFTARECAIGDSFEDVYADCFVPYPGRCQQNTETISGLKLSRIEDIYADLGNTVRHQASATHQPISSSVIDSLVDDPGIDEYAGSHYTPSPQLGCDWGYQMVKWGGAALYKLPAGSAITRGTRPNVTKSIPVANGGVAMAMFCVENSGSKGSESVNWTKYLWMPIKTFSSGSQFTVTSADIFAAAPSAFSAVGGVIWAYPGRSKGETWSQEAKVQLASVYIVANLRDRTRWA